MIKVNIAKATQIAHDIRRAKREEEFKPHDEVIAKRIPPKGKAVDQAIADAEAARAAIRAKYDQVQLDVDAATDEEGLRVVLRGIGVQA